VTTRVRSICVELDTADGGETVVIRPPASADAALWRSVCSCGAPSCEHRLVAEAAFAEASVREESVPPSAGPASVARPGSPERGGARGDPLLAELGTLIEAMLRAAAGEVTAAVEDALRATTDALATRPAPGVARVLGRVSSSLGARGSAGQTALAITALGEVAAALEGAHGDEVRAEVAGVGPEVARLDEIELVEVARMRERGPLLWETRVLIEPGSGALWREEGPAGARTLSTGVSGRRVLATLASRQLSRQPPRVSLMQYALEPAASASLLEHVAEAAKRDLSLPEDLAAAPLLGVACPRVAWLAPKDVENARGGAFLTDDGGRRLALERTRDPGAFEALMELLAGGTRVRALAGAFQVDVDGVRFQAWSALLTRDEGLELMPLSA
jgi:hypothetical protein